MRNWISRKPCGFTLAEVLAAGVILVIAGASLGLTVRNTMRSLALARDYQQATELLDKTLTRIDFEGPDAVLAEGTTEGEFDPPYERFAFSADIVPLGDGDLYEVTVRVSWATPTGDRRSAEVQTLLNAVPLPLIPEELISDET